MKVARLLYAALRVPLRKDRLQITRAGIHYEIDLSEGLDLALFLFGSFQKYVTNSKFLEVRDDAVIVDVGANAGFMTLRYAQIASRGWVYAFEPTPSGFARLRRNLELNPELSRRIVAIQSFLSDRAEPHPSITAYPSWSLRRHPNGQRHPIHGGLSERAAGVASVALDDFCSERGIDHIDIIKIDTDGHEIEVLRGARNVIERHRPTIIFEVGIYILAERDVPFELFCDYFSSVRYRMVNAKNGRVISREHFADEIPTKATIDILAIPEENRP
jgi:FkbM family methyltransferase